MAADDSDIDGDVKGICIREVKLLYKAFGMDVLCAEKEELALLNHMCHVVIGAVPPVTDKNSPAAMGVLITVNHVTEGFEFILLADRLDEGIRIGMGSKIEKGIYVHAVKAFCGMAFRDNIIRRGKGRPAEEGNRRAVSGNETVTSYLFLIKKSKMVEMAENSFQGIWA